MSSTDKPTLSGVYTRKKIPVTQEQIDKATRKDSSHCMIAESVKVAMPKAKSVSVDLATIRFTDPEKGLRYIYLTPPAAQRAVIAFDQGSTVEPFNLELRRPAQVLESGRKTAPDGSPRRPNRKQQGVTQGKGGNSTTTIPIRVGGTPPPNGALATTKGRIRKYGLKQLES